MKTSRAFTLIELLVVVFIIAILAAVALPQYQKAVERAKAQEGVIALRNLFTAQQAYYLANGSYASNLQDLDIDITIPANFTITYWSQTGMIVLQRTGSAYSYTLNLRNSQKIGYCYAALSNPRDVQICRSFGPVFLNDDQAERYYFFK